MKGGVLLDTAREQPGSNTHNHFVFVFYFYFKKKVVEKGAGALSSSLQGQGHHVPPIFPHGHLCKEGYREPQVHTHPL